MRLQTTLDAIELDWFSVPLKRSLYNMIPEKSGIYIIEGTTPLNLFDGLDEYRTPLYVGLSDVNLQGRFNNHCQGRLPGVKQLVNTWNTSGLIFKYSVIEDQIDERTIVDPLRAMEQSIETGSEAAGILRRRRICKFHQGNRARPQAVHDITLQHTLTAHDSTKGWSAGC